MFFAAAQPQIRRPAYVRNERSLERFLSESMQTSPHASPLYTQDDTSFHLTIDVPGVVKEQLTVAIEGSVVRIQTKEDAKRHYQAAIELPQEIDAGHSEAKLENGVLALRLSKKLPASNATYLLVQ